MSMLRGGGDIVGVTGEDSLLSSRTAPGAYKRQHWPRLCNVPSLKTTYQPKNAHWSRV